MLHGSVQNVQHMAGTPADVTCIISTYYDGTSFGELADFDLLKHLISEDHLEELSKQKYSCYANEECYVFKFNKRLLNAS